MWKQVVNEKKESQVTYNAVHDSNSFIRTRTTDCKKNGKEWFEE